MLPSSKVLITILITSFIIMIVLSIMGNAYEKEILSKLGNRAIAATYSKLIFLFFGTVTAITAIALFIRHFPRYAAKVIGSENPAIAQKINNTLTPSLMDNIGIVVILMTLLGSLFVAYKILTSST